MELCDTVTIRGLAALSPEGQPDEWEPPTAARLEIAVAGRRFDACVGEAYGRYMARLLEDGHLVEETGLSRGDMGSGMLWSVLVAMSWSMKTAGGSA